MNIKEILEAWLKPKDLSLVLEIEGTLGADQGHPEDPLAGTLFFDLLDGKYYDMLEPKYGGRHIAFVDGSKTYDKKSKFYVFAPAIRGQRGNIKWEEFHALYPGDGTLCYFLERKSEKAKCRIYAASLP